MWLTCNLRRKKKNQGSAKYAESAWGMLGKPQLPKGIKILLKIKLLKEKLTYRNSSSLL